MRVDVYSLRSDIKVCTREVERRLFIRTHFTYMMRLEHHDGLTTIKPNQVETLLSANRRNAIGGNENTVMYALLSLANRTTAHIADFRACIEKLHEDADDTDTRWSERSVGVVPVRMTCAHGGPGEGSFSRYGANSIIYMPQDTSDEVIDLMSEYVGCPIWRERDKQSGGRDRERGGQGVELIRPAKDGKGSFTTLTLTLTQEQQAKSSSYGLGIPFIKLASKVTSTTGNDCGSGDLGERTLGSYGRAIEGIQKIHQAVRALSNASGLTEQSLDSLINMLDPDAEYIFENVRTWEKTRLVFMPATRKQREEAERLAMASTMGVDQWEVLDKVMKSACEDLNESMASSLTMQAGTWRELAAVGKHQPLMTVRSAFYAVLKHKAKMDRYGASAARISGILARRYPGSDSGNDGSATHQVTGKAAKVAKSGPFTMQEKEMYERLAEEELYATPTLGAHTFGDFVNQFHSQPKAFKVDANIL